MDEIYSIRGALEGLSARLAARYITPHEIIALRSVFQQISDTFKAKDYKKAVGLHTQFNELILKVARSKHLHELVTRFGEYTERSQLRSISVPHRISAIRREHNTIINALGRKDGLSAEKAVRRHVEWARNAYFKSVQQWGE